MLRGKNFILVLVAYICVLSSLVVGFVTGFANNQPSAITYTHQTSSSNYYHTSLYAKKNKKKPKRAAQTTKGFGAPPPKLEDVLATFKSRLPDNADDEPCACGSGKVYGDCCGPLHKGERKCLTMTDVLRSRYTAFSYRNIKYVISTTHESCRDYREDKVVWAKDLDKGGMFDSFEFVKLQAGEEEMSADDKNEGFVEFKVTLRAKEDKYDTVAGQETVISERSRFLRNSDDGSWSYASGDVRSDVVGLEDTSSMLNEEKVIVKGFMMGEGWNKQEENKAMIHTQFQENSSKSYCLATHTHNNVSSN